MGMFDPEPAEEQDVNAEEIELTSFGIIPSYFQGYHKRYPTQRVFYRGKLTNHALDWYLNVCTTEELEKLNALKLSEKQQDILTKKVLGGGAVEVVKEKEFAITPLEKPEFPDAKQISWKKDSIIVTDFHEGKEYKTNYNDWTSCRNCGELRLCSGETGGSCPICDKTIGLKAYLEHFPKKNEKVIEVNEEASGSMFSTDKPKHEKTPEITTIAYNKEEAQDLLKIQKEVEKKHYVKEPTPLTVVPPQPIITRPTKEDIDWHLDMYNYVKSKVVNNSDFISIKKKKFLKKSGVRKFIPAFNLSVRLLPTEVYRLDIGGVEDWHATAKAIVSKPNGQFVEGSGTKSMSELFDKNIHNLRATAETRAVNRAILDLVAFGEVSAEEISESGKKGGMFN